MPSDVSISSVDLAARGAEALPARRLPVGIGLTIGAGASLALWTFIGIGLHALFT